MPTDAELLDKIKRNMAELSDIQIGLFFTHLFEEIARRQNPVLMKLLMDIIKSLQDKARKS